MKPTPVLAIGLVAAGLCLAPAAGRSAPAAPQGLTWKEVAALPDLTTGIWETEMSPRNFSPGAPPPLTPAYAAKLKAYEALQAAGNAQDSPAANCVPPGMPGVMNQPYPMQILYGPGQIAIQLEAYQQIRHIYTDGRKHPDDPDLTYNGNSIGHWEGDTLVVDSVGFTADTALGLSYGLRHSDKMHIVERFKLSDPDTLVITTTIDDPQALTAPWSSAKTFKRHRDWTISEYVCEQNNRNLVDANGHAGIILSPPGSQP